jgi:hypothetical protein
LKRRKLNDFGAPIGFWKMVQFIKPTRLLRLNVTFHRNGYTQ